MYIGITSESVPAELVITGVHLGLHYPSGNMVQHIFSDIKYFAKEPSCDYKWLASSGGNRVAKSINIKDCQIGRVSVSNSWHVGHIYLPHRTMYYSHQGKLQNTPTYEVLTCNKIAISTTSKPETSTSEVLINDLVELNSLNTDLPSQLKEH